MTLEEAEKNIGKVVKREAYKGCEDKHCSYGTITKVADRLVHVRYDGDNHSLPVRAEAIKLTDSKTTTKPVITKKGRWIDIPREF